MDVPEEQHNSRRADHLKPHRWKPGQSGNPGGRKPGSKSIKAAVRKMLEEGLDGRDISEVLGKVGIKKAMEGDFRFWQELWSLTHDDDLPDPARPDTPVDAVAFPLGAIPDVPRAEAVQDGPGGEAVGQDRDGQAQAGGGDDRKPDDPAPVA